MQDHRVRCRDVPSIELHLRKLSCQVLLLVHLSSLVPDPLSTMTCTSVVVKHFLDVGLCLAWTCARRPWIMTAQVSDLVSTQAKMSWKHEDAHNLADHQIARDSLFTSTCFGTSSWCINARSFPMNVNRELLWSLFVYVSLSTKVWPFLVWYQLIGVSTNSLMWCWTYSRIGTGAFIVRLFLAFGELAVVAFRFGMVWCSQMIVRARMARNDIDGRVWQHWKVRSCPGSEMRRTGRDWVTAYDDNQDVHWRERIDNNVKASQT